MVTGPVFLAVNGLFFSTDSALLFPVMFVLGVIEVALWVMTGALFASMVADVTEQRARATGRREEGLLFSAQSFVAKVAGGVGVWTGGIMLALISFPTNTASVDVDTIIVDRLGWLYAPVLAGLYLISLWVLTLYKIDRQTHVRNVAALVAALKEPSDTALK